MTSSAMPSIRFKETTHEHASRIGVTDSFSSIRRRLLVAKLEGRALPSGTPTHLQKATSEVLMATLALKPHAEGRNNDDGHETIVLVPTLAPPTLDRARGLVSRRLRRQRLASAHRAGTTRPLPPYGYQWMPQQTMVAALNTGDSR